MRLDRYRTGELMRMLVGVTFFFTLCFSALQAEEYHWGSSNGESVWVSPAGNGGIISELNAAFNYEDLPVTFDGLSLARQYGIFQPAAGDSLTIEGITRIKGDVEIRFTGALPAGELEVFEINIGTPETMDEPVTISSYTSSLTTISDYSQLIFNVAQGKLILVNVYSDLLFRSADALAGYDPEDVDSTGAPIPLFITVRGKGSVVFRLPSGKTVSFGPPSPGHGGNDEIDADSPLSTVGVSVQIYMEQGHVDVYGNESLKPRSQLVFEKWSYSADDINTDLALDTWINWGQRSSFVFISDNGQGVLEYWNDTDGNGVLDVGELVVQPGYGSIAFDPSNSGSGRLILQLSRGQALAGNDFTDAGFNIYGALLVPAVPSSTRQKASIFNSDFRTSVYFNQRAGLKAVMRIVDDVARYELVESEPDDDIRALKEGQWLARTVSARRGLVVINHNNSIPHFANNYDLADRIDNSVWGQYNNYEPGFILGVNGIIEVNAHLFLDYIANNSNKEIASVHADVELTHPSDRVKKHNPAALYTDGLPYFEKRSSRQTDQYGLPISDIQYVASSRAGGSHAVILLKGNAGCFVRSAAAYHDRALIRSLFVQPYSPEHYTLATVPDDTSLVRTVCLGIGVYNGVYIPVVDESNTPVMQSTELDGAHAIDIEGTCSIVSEIGAQGQPVAGYFYVPSIEIDYAGREVAYDNFEEWAAWQAWLVQTPGLEPTLVTLPVSRATVTFDENTNITLTQTPITLGRPLAKNSYYSLYDVSTIFVNAPLIFDGVTWIHADVTRKLPVPSVLPQPFMAALPHVVGGELASLNVSLYPPLIKLYNSTIACHESLVLSGVALTVHEYRGESGARAHNRSHIECYNRGREYDISGYGRVVQLGSQGNVYADGQTSSLLLSSAYLDVYRAAPPVDATVESPTIIQLSFDSPSEMLVNPLTEKSLHSLYLANSSQVHLGWPTLEGDSDYLPAMMDGDVLAQLIAADRGNKNKFRFNPYATGVGHLQFNGGPFYIGAGDSVDGIAPDKPIPGIDVDGVVYVNYGGKLSPTPATDVYIDTVIGRRNGAIIESSGVVVSPRDQVHYLAGGLLQDYSLDFDTDIATTGTYINNIIVNNNEPILAIDVPKIYETSTAESVMSISDGSDDE